MAKALAQLALSRDQVDVDVVSEGKRGVFGIGAEDAVVRVATRGNVLAPDTRPPAARPPRQERPARRQDDRPRERPPQRERAQGERAPQRDARPSGGGGGGDGGSSAPMRGRGGPPMDRPIPGAGAPSAVRVPGTPDELPYAPPEDAEDAVDFAGRTLRDLLTLLGLTDTEISARDPETAGDGAGLAAQVFDVYGSTADASDELGLLIGRRGETLSALQYLLNVLTAQRHEGEHVFSLDVEQYRRRREDTLIDIAKRIAQEVRESGDVITLEPMPAAERRIVHLTLAEEPGVRTESVGTGPDRQVEVMPDVGE